MMVLSLLGFMIYKNRRISENNFSDTPAMLNLKSYNDMRIVDVLPDLSAKVKHFLNPQTVLPRFSLENQIT